MMVKEKENETVSKALASLMIRVTAMERLLQREGVITREKYVKELESCAEEMNIMMSVSTSSNKILS